MIRYRTVALPLVAAGLVVGAYVAPESSEGPRRPAGVEVTQTTYGCPAGAGLTVGAGQVSPGTKGSATVLPSKKTDDDLAGASTWRTSKVAGSGVVVEQSGRGSGPGGFFAATAPRGSGGGLIVGSCAASVDDGWFLGLGSGAKHFSTVILTNPTDAPAAVDLDLWGPDGKIDAVDSKGVVIDPFTTRRIKLADLAAGEPELALRVLRRRGAVSAVVNDYSTSVFGGTEPVTATASPRRSQVIGGLVPGTSGRTLAILNPGTATARIDVDVIGAKSTFKAEGLGGFKVKPRSLRLVEIPATAGSGRLGLKITSDEPVSATVRMAPSESDYAYAEAVPLMTGPAIVPVDLGKGVKDPDLVLTAPDRTTSVQVFVYDEDMKELGMTERSITGGTTIHVDSARFPQKDIAYMVVQSKAGVVASATYTDGSRISSLALLSAPIRVQAPQVRPID